MRYIHKEDVFTTLRYLGMLMMAIGIMNLVPIIVDIIYLEYNFTSYLFGGSISICLGYILYTSLRNKSGDINLKHAMIISSLGWLWAGISGAIVMTLCLKLEFISGVFENISALTGTGASLFTNVETLPYSILFFRSIEQWIGGLGVVILIIGLLNTSGSASSKLYQSEAREERLKPSIKNTLNKTIEIYLIYTTFGIIVYYLAGMPLFDSVCNTFTTISTGGMGIKNANIGYYQSDLIYLITIILMILGATSFLVHYKIIKTKGKALIEDIQFKVLITIIATVCIITYLLTKICPMEILFTIVSSITTCGASIVPFSTIYSWPAFIINIMMCLMLIGGSSGSTAGAIKLPRIILSFKEIYRHVREILSPEGRVITIKLNGNRIPDKIISDAGNYIILYIVFILLSWTIFVFFSFDPLKSLFDVISLQGNIGFEAGLLNCDTNPILLIVSIFNMWIGRLEIFPVLILLRSVFEIFEN